MPIDVNKEHERKLLIKRIFPTPYAGYEHMLPLFQICRDMKDLYCLNFNENGYTADYKSFKSEEVISRAAKLLTDDRLLYYVERYKDKLSAWSDFKGKYYTYEPKTRSLKLESEWEKLKTMLDEFFENYSKDGKAVLSAIWEANVKRDKKRDNWFIIKTLAEDKYGLKKHWLKIISRFEIIGIIERHKGDIWIPEELIPLVGNVLQRWNG